MDKIITMEDIEPKHIHESQGSLRILELHLTKIGQFHLTLADEDGNTIDFDLEPVLIPVITPSSQVPAPDHVEDGEPRIPKAGEIIKAFGKFVIAKSNTVSSTKKQVYVLKSTNETANENSIPE